LNLPQPDFAGRSARRDEVNGSHKSVIELDIFVNNAGILIRGTIGSYSLEDLDRMLDINVRAAFVGIEAVSEHMKDGGRIILIGSNTTVRAAFPGASVYSMLVAIYRALWLFLGIFIFGRGTDF
jgi:3-oxoacyl-[acyl-carrier protein] reductase